MLRVASRFTGFNSHVTKITRLRSVALFFRDSALDSRNLLRETFTGEIRVEK